MRWGFLIFILGLGSFLGSYFLMAPVMTKVYPVPTKVSETLLPQAKLPESKTITLMFVGDIMLDRGVKYMVDKYGGSDYKFPFLKIKLYLEEADILLGNLESVISDKGGEGWQYLFFPCKAGSHRRTGLCRF